MKKWMQAAVAFFSIVGMLVSGSSISAASQKPIVVYIDGTLQENVLTVNGRTMVQLIAFKDPVNLVYSYEQATKTIKIINKEMKMTVRLNVGSTTALVNGISVKLDAPVTIKEGRTYLPLRFLSETLGGSVKYNSTEKTVIVRTPSGQERFITLMSGNLEDARTIAIHTPTTLVDKEIVSNGEGFHTIYTFPKGEALRYQVQYRGLIKYIEVNSDGIAVVKWQKDTIGANGETGKQPEDFNESVYFSNNFMAEILNYGTIDIKGGYNEVGIVYYNIHKDFKGIELMPIEGETRTDRHT
ncbi:copper amine oxidase N-terminal domain-containing protein [Paenibacillus harenae]|uniref:copper amine oxidase N-terminal domain-containing protein n=1 Tax=Paenibacillus harenae TaxID=306543 RepID=UPI00041F3B74|nr:copper amine oxidase N-terminal domain-containing protein [Paenibacillus harenae]